jgi:C4-dicarboxylate-binding protein DctP
LEDAASVASHIAAQFRARFIFDPGRFAILRHPRGDASLELRSSLATAPSHPRNVALRDFLGKSEEASSGQVKIKLFESGSLFPDLQVLKALLQGQGEMACPGTWTITGVEAP